MEQEKKKSRLPIVALCMDIACPACILVGIGCFATVVLMPIGIILFLAALIFPFIAIVCGICALCLGKKEIGTGGMALSVIAILIPIIATLVLIILFSTGVAYIRFM